MVRLSWPKIIKEQQNDYLLHQTTRTYTFLQQKFEWLSGLEYGFKVNFKKHPWVFKVTIWNLGTSIPIKRVKWKWYNILVGRGSCRTHSNRQFPQLMDKIHLLLWLLRVKVLVSLRMRLWSEPSITKMNGLNVPYRPPGPISAIHF